MEVMDEKIKFLSGEAIPAALSSLAARQETLTQVIQYLESTYLSPDSDKKATENEAKKFLINAVTSVATDIESAAVSFDQLLSLNIASVEALTAQVDVMQSKLRIGREQNALNSYHDIRVSRKQLVGEPTREEPLPITSASPRARPERVPISKRLTKLDQVGLASDSLPSTSRPHSGVPLPGMDEESHISASSNSSPRLKAGGARAGLLS